MIYALSYTSYTDTPRPTEKDVVLKDAEDGPPPQLDQRQVEADKDVHSHRSGRA